VTGGRHTVERMARPGGGEQAQASIELVALAPLLLLVLACVWQAALVGWALTAAESASRSGARAALVGRPARPAALAALPDSMRPGATAGARDGRVVVTVRVPSVVPGFAPRITSSAPVVGR
jgi:pilus assembly protein CpaE